MEVKRICCFKYFLPILLILLHYLSSDVEGVRRRYRKPPPPLVKVGNDIVSLRKPTPTQTVDLESILSLGGNKHKQSKSPVGHYHGLSNRADGAPKPSSSRVFILRRRRPSLRALHGLGNKQSLNQQLRYLSNHADYDSTSLQQNRRSYSSSPRVPLYNSNKRLAMQNALQRSRAIKAHRFSSAEGKANYYRSILPLWYQYKLQKQAAAYAKYLSALQLLSLATHPDPAFSSYSPELAMYLQPFQNSPYSSLLNTSFVPTNFVTDLSTNHTAAIAKNATKMVDQVAEATQAKEKSDIYGEEFTSLQREIEKQKRKLLEVFPPPESEIPFGERTILMVRFPPVPHHKSKEIIKLKSAFDIDGGITFGGPRWHSFGTPFNPYDHPWNHEAQIKKDHHHHHHHKVVFAEADKPSSYGVIITQNFVYKPSIRFTNSDPKLLAKNKGNALHGGPGIVAQLAKALAEGNRISNSYFLSKAFLHGKAYTSHAKKPPFVIVHLDTYTKKSNTTGAFGLDKQEEANYANGTIIYPTINDPHILASTKFEFHDGSEIEGIFDKPLATHGHGHGWGKEVPIHPKGIREIKNFLRLIYKVHQEAHDGGKTKIDDLRKLGDQLDRPAFPDSKPLLRDQIADRSTNWLHTSSVGIRSLSEDDDHFPYDKHPLVDVSKDYDDHY